jgi:2-polyprenyl-3-methyl-5-hydroxy-6-metoxy-1,4-benzoquinol methylase
MDNRAQNEIAHGKKLLNSGAENIWGWGSPAGQRRANRRAQWIIKAAGLGPGIRALEIGCGTGIFTEYFSNTGVELLAVDISEDLLNVVRNRKLSPSVKLLCTAFENLPAEQQFDAIVGSSILHHLEIQSELTRIYELLKPGGVIAFGEPNMLNPQVMLQKNIPWIKERLGDSPNETAFFSWQLRAILSKVGFEDISIIHLDWLHPLTPEKFLTVTQKMGELLEKIPFVNQISGSLYIRAKKPLLTNNKDL